MCLVQVVENFTFRSISCFLVYRAQLSKPLPACAVYVCTHCCTVSTVAMVFVPRINRILSDGWSHMLPSAAGRARLQRCFKNTKDKDSEVMGSL